MLKGKERVLKRIQWLPSPVSEVFPFFADAKNLERITPPWLRFRITYQSHPRIEKGCIFKYRLKVHGFPIYWTTEIIEWDENRSFVDFQMKGPYRLWHHTHTFVEKNGGTEMTDVVRYRLPFGKLGDLVAGSFVEKDVAEIFDYRFQVIESIFRKS